MKWLNALKNMMTPSPPVSPPAVEEKTPISYGAEYIEHNIPHTLPAKSVYPAKLILKNTGDFIWRPYPPNGNSVDLAVRFNEKVVATHKLPKGEVRPGDQVTLHFMLKVPSEEGPVTMSMELVEQNVSLFTDKGVDPLLVELMVGPPSGDLTDELFDLAFRYNPWHYQPTRGISKSLDGGEYPVFISRSKGCRLWAPSGREYIDYVMGWGSTLLGYADDRVQQGIMEAVNMTAPVIPYPHPVEMEVSRMICEDFPCADMVIFGKHGSDMCTLAARTARVVTGKKHILFSGYHGWQDFWAEQLGFAKTGIPERPELLIHRYKYNDKEAFLKLYHEYKNDLAAVMIEPAGPWGGNDIGFEADADTGFLKILSDAAHDAGALLVFDEIVTGYRYPGGSVQKATGVIPDMACLGKALASGMPLSALVGKASIFTQGLPNTAYGPTFKWEIYSFAAARAAIQVYRDEPVAEFVWDYGLKLREGINEIIHRVGIRAECTGPPFRMSIIFSDEDPDRLPMMKALFQQELLKRGLSTYNGIMLPSFAHDEEVLENTFSIMEQAMETVAKAAERDELDTLLEIPPLIDL